MRALLILLSTAMVTSAAGCATPMEIQQKAYEHEQRASYYAARGDYARAEKERRKADKQWDKAAYRSAWYNQWY
jgi:hypothetical protein